MNTKSASSAAPLQRPCYQAFCVAGELFGRLRDELGFGDLGMRTPTWGPSAPPRAVSFYWSFNVKGDRYAVSETVSLIELEHLRSVEAFAVSVAARWNKQGKGQGLPDNDQVDRAGIRRKTLTNQTTETKETTPNGETVAASVHRFVHPPLVLSLFPGVGLLDRAFEAEGFCVVRGPDVLWGGDVREFHPPAGKFDGIIGGPPCQSFSSWKSIVKGSGADVSFGNLIPEFERCISEANPTWFVMENVRAAPVPSVEGYATWSCLLNNRQCIDGDEPAKQSRERRWTFGDARTGQRTVLMIETAALHNPRFEYAATIGGGHRRDRPAQAAAMERNGMKSRKSAAAFEHFKRIQGLPDEWDLPPFKTEEKVRAVCNGVPLAMGRSPVPCVMPCMDERLS